VLSLVNEWLKAATLEVQEYVRLCAATWAGAFTRPIYYRDIIQQFEQIGWGSLTVVVLTGLFTGAVLALQSGMTLDQFGARPFVGRLVSASMVKELGPVLTALMLTAGTIMAPVLTVISDLVGVVGGWVIAVFQLRVASSVYWTSVLDGLYQQDPWMGLIKPFFLGFAIVSIACHVGLRTRGGTQGVGRSVTNAVVAASVAVLAVDFFITRLLISVMY
jgi:phospholipid/cholesterol/gamma-HCH transport system permease protein